MEEKELFTEDQAKEKLCILSKTLFKKIMGIYQPDIIPKFKLKENDNCIASSCEHWKVITHDGLGYCDVGLNAVIF